MKAAQLLVDHSRRAAAGICPRTGAAAGQRAGDGLGLRAPAHGDRAGAGLAGEVPAVRQGGLVRRLAGPGASRRRCRTAARSAASCNIPTWPRRSKPTSTSSRWCSRSASASTRRSAPTRSRPRSRTRLREELDYRREARHVALYRHMLRDEPNVHVPETGAGAIDRPAADHELAGRRAAAQLEGARPGGARRARHQHVPRLVRAVLSLRRDPRRPASRQLHGAARRLGQPDGFRLRARLSAAFRARLDRALSRPA